MSFIGKIFWFIIWNFNVLKYSIAKWERDIIKTILYIRENFGKKRKALRNYLENTLLYIKRFSIMLALTMPIAIITIFIMKWISRDTNLPFETIYIILFNTILFWYQTYKYNKSKDLHIIEIIWSLKK